MNDSDLDRSVPDWHLPLRHELYWSAPFMRPGRTFLDVGAHVGTWTLRLAPLFERVFAFEPDARAFAALRKNVQLAGLKNVQLVPQAVTNRVGTAELTITPNPSTNTMFWKESERTDARLGTEAVLTVDLDTFCKTRGIDDVDLVKVDVEGAEMLVVEGAQKLLKEQRPDLFVEMHGLFATRLRRLIPYEMDVIDGGQHGLSLVKHRDEWPLWTPPNFRVYPHPTSPGVADYEELRRMHGLPEAACKAPTTGWLSEGGQ